MFSAIDNAMERADDADRKSAIRPEKCLMPALSADLNAVGIAQVPEAESQRLNLDRQIVHLIAIQNLRFVGALIRQFDFDPESCR